MCVVFVDGLVKGFDALRVWNESGEAGVQVVSWASLTSRGPRAAGLGHAHANAVAGGGHRLWGDEHRAPGHCDKYYVR